MENKKSPVKHILLCCKDTRRLRFRLPAHLDASGLITVVNGVVYVFILRVSLCTCVQRVQTATSKIGVFFYKAAMAMNFRFPKLDRSVSLPAVFALKCKYDPEAHPVQSSMWQRVQVTLCSELASALPSLHANSFPDPTH